MHIIAVKEAESERGKRKSGEKRHCQRRVRFLLEKGQTHSNHLTEAKDAKAGDNQKQRQTKRKWQEERREGKGVIKRSCKTDREIQESKTMREDRERSREKRRERWWDDARKRRARKNE